MNATDVIAVTQYVRRLEESDERNTFTTAAHGMAALFGAESIGLTGPDGAVVDGENPKHYPWLKDSDLRSRVRASKSALTHRDNSGEWLLGQLGDTLAWAHRTGRRGWGDAECWAWMLAGEALVRWQQNCDGARVQRRLEQAGAITGRLSHDFGNFLTGIMGFSELALTHAPADSVLQRYLQEVLVAARQGAEWLRRLHLFCRRGASSTFPTLLSSVVAQEQSRLQAAGLSNLRLAAEVPSDLPLLDIDADALQAALLELVNNAREACKERGTITLAARRVERAESTGGPLLGAAPAGPCVEITVSDDGPGIADEDRQRLFRELFFSTKPRQRGLGLLIVYGIMQRCRGALRVSRGAAGGTSVQLYVPTVSVERLGLAGAASPRIILVLANPHLADSMQCVLESAGCQTAVAASAPAAIAHCADADQPFALGVVDVLLPQMTGCDLARRLVDLDKVASFLFVHTQSSFHGLTGEEMLERFPLLRWPLNAQAFLAAVRTALTTAE